MDAVISKLIQFAIGFVILLGIEAALLIYWKTKGINRKTFKIRAFVCNTAVCIAAFAYAWYLFVR